jgi:hypothetical protein
MSNFRLTILSKCSRTDAWSLGSTSASSFNTTYTFHTVRFTYWNKHEAVNGVPQHTQKVWQISKVFCLAYIDFPIKQYIKEWENIEHHKWAYLTWKKRVVKLTLISNKRTCFGFASPSIKEVATDEPGWVMWNPIPGTSYKQLIRRHSQSKFFPSFLDFVIYKNFKGESQFITWGSIRHSCSWPHTTKSRKRGKKCSFIALFGFVFILCESQYKIASQ